MASAAPQSLRQARPIPAPTSARRTVNCAETASACSGSVPRKTAASSPPSGTSRATAAWSAAVSRRGRTSASSIRRDERRAVSMFPVTCSRRGILQYSAHENRKPGVRIADAFRNARPSCRDSPARCLASETTTAVPMRALRIISGHRRKRNLKEASLALAGRTEELARLEELLDDAVRGSGNSVTIRGVVGCGKTALLHAFAARAAARGVTVLTAAGSRAERALPLGVLSQLLNDVPGDDAPAASVRRLLDRAMAAVRPDSAGGAAEQARIMRELWLAVHALARERPLLIGVDDVQHADEASLRYLLYFVRRINGAR